MHNTLLFHDDHSPFSPNEIAAICRSAVGFSSIRFNEPGGALVEARFAHGDDSIFVRLNSDSEAISLTRSSDAVLQAALILQRHHAKPMRIIDTYYSYDLYLPDFTNIKELRDAILAAQSDE
jgi:hypothetical protein